MRTLKYIGKLIYWRWLAYWHWKAGVNWKSVDTQLMLWKLSGENETTIDLGNGVIAHIKKNREVKR